MNTQLYSVYEAAKAAGCGSHWIRTLLAEGRLEGAYKVDGQWRIPASALEEVKQRKEVNA